MVAISIMSTEPPIPNPSPLNPTYLKAECAQESAGVLVNVQISIPLLWSLILQAWGWSPET